MKYNYLYGENYLKTKRYLYLIKTYNMIGNTKMKYNVYIKENKNNRYAKKAYKTMASQNFNINGMISNTEGYYIQVSEKHEKSILKRLSINVKN